MIFFNGICSKKKKNIDDLFERFFKKKFETTLFDNISCFYKNTTHRFMKIFFLTELIEKKNYVNFKNCK